MRIAACYKNVPDNEKIKLAPDNSLDLSAAAPQIGQYDLNAVEAAVEIAAGRHRQHEAAQGDTVPRRGQDGRSKGRV